MNENLPQQHKIEKHKEIIECTECGKIQEAEVLHTSPWWSYVHDCINCKHTITESEWTLSNQLDICIDCKGSGAIKVSEEEYQKCPCQNN